MQEQRSFPRHFALIYSYRKMLKKNTYSKRAKSIFLKESKKTQTSSYVYFF
jgi:hypothetical protein